MSYQILVLLLWITFFIPILGIRLVTFRLTLMTFLGLEEMDINRCVADRFKTKSCLSERARGSGEWAIDTLTKQFTQLFCPAIGWFFLPYNNGLDSKPLFDVLHERHV